MRAPKNILLLASWFPNKNDASHGIFIKKHAQAVAEQNNVFVIHVCSDAGLAEKFRLDYSEENGLKIIIAYYKKATGFLSPLLKIRRYKKAFSLAIQKMKEKGFAPELVHLNVIMPMAVVAHNYCKRKGLPLVITEHWTGYMERDGLYTAGPVKLFTERAVEYTEAVTVVSERLQQSMQQQGLLANYVVIPNIVEGAAGIITPKPAKPFKIGIVAALYDRQKNISSAITALKQLVHENYNVEMHIAGEGDDETMLKGKAGNFLDYKIFFKGYLRNNAIFDFYNSVNCLLVPSHFETFSVVAAEALCSGLPVITTACGGPEDFVNADCGIVVESDSPAAIAAAVKDMVKRYDAFNPEKISNYASALFKKDAVIQKFNEVYDTALK